MSGEGAGGLPAGFEIPFALTAGVYANALLVWHSEHEFTFDFAASQVPAEAEDEAPVLVVARVRVPVTYIFDVLRILNAAMTDYEREYGEIRRARRDDV